MTVIEIRIDSRSYARERDYAAYDPFYALSAVPCWQSRDRSPSLPDRCWMIYSREHRTETGGKQQRILYHAAVGTRGEAIAIRDAYYSRRRPKWADESYHIAPMRATEGIERVLNHLAGVYWKQEN